MLKVDLKKAFDSVKWDFVLGVLQAVGLPQRFIGWISECISTPSFSVIVNGVPSGFFQSTRGLRQGDSLSPYLFVLSMQVFSRLLQSRYNSGDIGYHPKTSILEISHLMFADDVMIFFDGSCNSLHGITETLDDFASWSGLRMNQDKTELFHSGLSVTEANAIARYNYASGSLPIRYLGLPLMSRKLKISEYSPLLDKITSQFRFWAVKSLSFAGRRQLIASVITGLVTFWCSSFLLPKGCMKQIESLCARFLWSGDIDKFRQNKVAWSRVCLPRNQGGLGLKKFTTWNVALCLKLIWRLFDNTSSLWVRWQQVHHLKRNSFCAIKTRSTDSWTWKSLLQLKPLAASFVHCHLGNGLTAKFWYDRWCPFGDLITYLGPFAPQQLRLHLNANVAAACNDNDWILPSPRSDAALELHTYFTTITAPTPTFPHDSYVWKVNGISSMSFSSKLTYNSIRQSADIVSWERCVWFTGATPRNSFLMWVSTLNRLPTKDRLISWGMSISPVLLLCQQQHENRTHLFLSCTFAKIVWDFALNRIGFAGHAFLSWSELLSWVKQRNESAPSTLRKIVSQAIISRIWRQRNNLLHNQQVIPAATVFREVYCEVKNTISAHVQRRKFSKLMQLWII